MTIYSQNHSSCERHRIIRVVLYCTYSEHVRLHEQQEMSSFDHRFNVDECSFVERKQKKELIDMTGTRKPDPSRYRIVNPTRRYRKISKQQQTCSNSPAVSCVSAPVITVDSRVLSALYTTYLFLTHAANPPSRQSWKRKKERKEERKTCNGASRHRRHFFLLRDPSDPSDHSLYRRNLIEKM